MSGKPINLIKTKWPKYCETPCTTYIVYDGNRITCSLLFILIKLAGQGMSQVSENLHGYKHSQLYENDKRVTRFKRNDIGVFNSPLLNQEHIEA